MKFVIGFVFATALAATPALAWECGSKAPVTASTEVATPVPVQTAEAPSTTTTK